VSFMVIVGGMYDYNKPDSKWQKLPIIREVLHPKLNESVFPPQNDIALLKLGEDFRYTPEVSPVCLPSRDVADNTMCVTTGWGKGPGR